MMPAAEAVKAMRSAILEFQKPKMAKATLNSEWAASHENAGKPGVVVNYASASRTLRSKSASRKGLTASGSRFPRGSVRRPASNVTGHEDHAAPTWASLPQSRDRASCRPRAAS